MRLFSEKVTPTFTSSNLNILTVESFQEVFFDVFEFEINGKKFIAEKVSEYKGAPVVNVPIVLEGVELEAPFVLQEGKFSILFNEKNTVPSATIHETPIEISYKSGDEEIEAIIFERREAILQDIKEARELAEKHAVILAKKKEQESDQYFAEKQEAFNKELADTKKGLVEEFLSLSENIRSDVFEFTQDEANKLKDYIIESVEDITETLSKNLDGKIIDISSKLNESINELASNILTGTLLKEIQRNKQSIDDTIAERFVSVKERVDSLFNVKEEKIEAIIAETLKEVERTATILEKEHVDLRNVVNVSVNKSLSRVGNVKAKLEENLKEVSSELRSEIELVEGRVKSYYDDKIIIIENKIENVSKESKEHFISLVEESKRTLLDEIQNIKVEVPNIIIERSNGKQEIDLKGIKGELEKVIGTRFTNEVQSLKRLIEMSSGGGSVAKQFAQGGTMDGSLTIIGAISASQYLGIPTSGGADTAVRSLTSNWENTYTTVQTNSSTWTTFDYTHAKFFPLTGGTVTGNVTVNGNLTATGTTTFANTVFSVTSALSVVHIGAGPAMWVGNNGAGDIASFYDIDQNVEILHVGGINSTYPNVGIKTSEPNKTLTVVGEISSTSHITTTGNISSSGTINGTNLVYTSTNQTIAGEKTFSDDTTFNGVDNTMPNQTYVGGSSIITGAIGDARYGGPTVFQILTSNTTGNQVFNSTTFTDTGLSATLTSPGIWQFSAQTNLSANGLSTSKFFVTTRDGSIQYDTTSNGFVQIFIGNGVATTDQANWLQGNRSLGGAARGTAKFDGFIYVTSAPVTLVPQFAQNTGANITLKVVNGSYVMARKIS